MCGHIKITRLADERLACRSQCAGVPDAPQFLPGKHVPAEGRILSPFVPAATALPIVNVEDYTLLPQGPQGKLRNTGYALRLEDVNDVRRCAPCGASQREAQQRKRGIAGVGPNRQVAHADALIFPLIAAVLGMVVRGNEHGDCMAAPRQSPRQGHHPYAGGTFRLHGKWGKQRNFHGRAVSTCEHRQERIGPQNAMAI